MSESLLSSMLADLSEERICEMIPYALQHLPSHVTRPHAEKWWAGPNRSVVSIWSPKLLTRGYVIVHGGG